MARNFAGGLLARIVNRPLLATPAMARFYLGYLATRDNLDGLLIEAGEVRPVSDLTAVGKYEYRDGKTFATVRDSGIAVLEIYGSLAHKYGAIGPSSGMTGYDGLERQLDDAVKDPSVRGILLDVHSHGGEVAGCFDLADKIHAARAHKPVWAIADEVAYSAAFALASQADRIVTTRTGGVGSVGVVMMHTDFSKNLEQEGIKVTLIHAGAHKVDGNPFEPLPEDVRAELQAEVDAAYAMFTALVARGCGIDEKSVAATQARCLVPADALDVGFIDAVMPAADVFDEFTQFLASGRVMYPAA